jgi:Ca2+-binding RTX toxin-like protein
LSKATFTALTSGVGGALVSSDFAIVTSDAAVDASSAFIVYNSSNGSLFYNLDGFCTGSGEYANIAQLDNCPPLTVNDFLVQG